MTRTYVSNYASITEMLEKAAEARKNGRLLRDGILGSKDFVGRKFRDWAAVEAAALEPWPEGLDIVQEMLFELRNSANLPTPTCVRRRARWADDGDELDNDRLRSGQEAWRTMRRESQRGPTTVTVLVNVSANGSVKADDILWRGAAAIVLTDLLEQAGYRVVLIGCDTGRGAFEDGSDWFGSVRLKASEQPLDIPSVVNGLSGWFFRTVCFQAYHNERRSTPARGYGWYKPLTTEMAEVLELAGNTRAFLVDGVWTRQAAVAMIQKIVGGLDSQ